MHGLIFVTWEKYLTERFGVSLLNTYRAALGETVLNAPLASRVYDDEQLLAGVKLTSQLTRQPVHLLLREYGHYFIINGLTSHLCAYLLNRVHSARELLLIMRDAHLQMRCTPDSLTPPLFAYEPLSTHPNDFVLIYDSPRKLCPLLQGAIEGAAERFGETVVIFERTCMKKGATACRFELHFRPSYKLHKDETPERQARRRAQRQLAELVLATLPNTDGITLRDLHKILSHQYPHAKQVRISALLEAINHLQHAGLVASSANLPGDTFTSRRYWRVRSLDMVHRTNDT
ncbi:MAG: hypothetical protein E6J34_03490 [Chloroflexi bacterium]|nr:MAG: hypothetical protein E6J34_03490 [Chloroflexota bacterium]